jgi:hypothetical protein
MWLNFLTTGGSFKECALAFITLTTIRTYANAFFNCISALYAQCKLFFGVVRQVTIPSTTNLIKI